MNATCDRVGCNLPYGHAGYHGIEFRVTRALPNGDVEVEPEPFSRPAPKRQGLWERIRSLFR